MFRVVDGGVIRAVTHPNSLDLPAWPRLSGDAAQQSDAWRAWLASVWSQPWVVEAVEIASPDLARDIARTISGHGPKPSEVRRLVVSLARYLLRAASRPTPFGIFAGAAATRPGATPIARIGELHTTTTRVEAAWLEAVITRLESSVPLMKAVPVVANTLAYARGGRLVLGGRQNLDAAGRDAPVEVTVAHTAAVQTALRAAESPVAMGVLASKLCMTAPAASPAKVEAMLLNLVTHRMLVSSLRPPTTVADALGHVVAQAAMHGGDHIGETAPVLAGLRAIHTALAELDELPLTAYERRRSLRAAVGSLSTTITTAVPQHLAVTQRLDVDVVLPETVSQAAAEAASVLMRLAHRGPSPAWQHYHGRFVERYGPGTLVSVTELINPNIGLGFPAGFRDAPDEPATGLTARDRALLDIAQRAALTGTSEITLTDAMIADLGEEPDPLRLPPHTEIAFQIHASHAADLATGDFTLAVATLSRHAGALTGRLLPALPTADRDRIAAAYAAIPTLDRNAGPAQVVCEPMYALAGNVARIPAVLPRTIPLGQHSTGPGSIAIGDLAVGATADRLYIMQLSTRQLIEPRTFSALEARNFTHPVARFLAEVSTWHTTTPHPFSWGAASSLPFLPRIRHRQTILRPAQWRLHRTDLPHRDQPWDSWDRQLTEWQRTYRAPDRALLGDTDMVIRLDLTDPTHRELLRDHLDRQPDAVLREAPPSHAFDWLHGRAHEIVLPLAPSRAQPEPSFDLPHPRSLAHRDDAHLPGAGHWLYAKVYAPAARHHDILTGDLTHLWDDDPDQPTWWFIRYSDPEPHIRLRIHLTGPTSYGAAAARIGRWVHRLREAGLTGRLQLDTYQPELGRYGTKPATAAAAHAVFAADSTAAITQLAAPHLHPLAATAASMTAIATGLLGTHERAMTWLLDHIPRQTAATTPAARPISRQAIALAAPSDRWAAMRAAPGGDRIAAAWLHRDQALRAYACQLTANDPSVDSVLGSLLHMHHVRMAGLDTSAELQAHRLARAVALRHLKPSTGRP
ncbi:thiopeptide-type bacteriocin biosynthesis protein [Allocatelliglobosispora scoriae]|uniref:Thiopeptide-type bacteriocin biosynthesis protein n=1 Tax=Allocatelliglobosispora scoriae TaxID=643052 RepID=A0A841BYB1_9ACTN|nr:lantibiotic dehydratase [Allocatelliglobosispora scoriae]MBB5871913.1 thiopeptide-type bacteriocin biosynthesis protein [Allocatelliglobosispora scoriae]